MSAELPTLFLARHGDTAWTDSQRHTGRTDVPLNECGEEHARQLGAALATTSFLRVFTSPLQRAAKTCALAGFGTVAKIDPDLVEWDYGQYEGKLTRDIVRERPGWELFWPTSAPTWKPTSASSSSTRIKKHGRARPS